MNWDVREVEPFERNTLKCFFTLIAGPFAIKKCTYHESGEKSWVGCPGAPLCQSSLRASERVLEHRRS